jgi:broad specificity phosphatase PhoE
MTEARQREMIRNLFQQLLFPWPQAVILCRHGESEGNVEFARIARGEATTYSDDILLRRNMDLRLSPRGEKQAIITGDYLRVLLGGREYVVYCSPFERAIQTAELATCRLRNEFKIDERLREKDFGVFDALTPAERRKRYEDWVRLKDLLDKFYFRLPGGENYPDMILRFKAWLSMIKREHCDQILVVFCHSAIMEAARYAIEGLNEKTFLELAETRPIENASLLLYRGGTKPNGKPKLYPVNGRPIVPWQGKL